ncbi:MAG: hypothetical protein Q7V02_10005 [Methylophilus sp.]|nr:hypothetical protein [Methylophilus sp.]
MKMKQIALLVTGLMASSYVLAASVTPQEISDARAAGTLQQAWISGASAPTRTIYEGWVSSGNTVGCDLGTNTIFTNSATGTTPGGLGNFVAYACRRNGIISVLYQTLDGGSLNAYTPHTVGTRLARLKFVGNGNGCSATTFNYIDQTNNENNATMYRGCTRVGAALPATGATAQSNLDNAAAIATDPLAPQLPVGGFSDVEAGLFSASIGGGDVSSRGVESDANVGQVFGVAVSIPLYRALQAAQGLSDVNASTFDIANAPNITRTQYITIASSGGAANGDWSPILGNNPGVVKLERRVDTSGSQASSNAFFMQNPCASGVNAALTPAATATDSAGNFLVTENSGSGDVKTRITTASSLGSQVNTADQGYAIGVLSLENNWRLDSGTQNGYRYVKVDGVHPEAGDLDNARVAAANGNYAFHMELKSFVRSNYAGAPTKTAFENNVIGQITTALANPPANACALLPRGLTLNPLSGSICGRGVQVAKITNFGNNCSPAQLTPAE